MELIKSTALDPRLTASSDAPNPPSASDEPMKARELVPKLEPRVNKAVPPTAAPAIVAVRRKVRREKVMLAHLSPRSGVVVHKSNSHPNQGVYPVRCY